MEPIEFTKKFLQDYEKKRKQLEQGVKAMFNKLEVSEYDFDAGMVSGYFPEALQNFADRICEKQRKNCLDSFMKECRDTFDQITNAEQPKTDEL